MGGHVRSSEWIAAGYFLYLLVPIWRDRSKPDRASLILRALLLALAVVAISQVPDAPAWRAVRDWAPGLYLLAGYWLPGRLFSDPNERLERWLLAADSSCLGPRVVSATLSLPGIVLEYLELAYLLCYPLVPLAFGVVYFGSRDPASLSAVADGYWTAVLLAVFSCYGLLPWLPTRPPRALLIAGVTSRSVVRRLNHIVLNRASIQVNTFPSGHVAAALASALAVGALFPLAGAIIGLLAVSIAVAAVVGRYHYGADVVLGALAAVLAFAASRWI
jgi:membrane-associated phospholipid phosphatase